MVSKSDADGTFDFHFDYNALVTKIKKNKETGEEPKRLELWIPVPQDDEVQTISNIVVTGATEYRFTNEPEYGNKMLYTVIDAPFPEEIKVTVEFDVSRREVSSMPTLRAGALQKDTNRLVSGDLIAPIDGDVLTKAEDCIKAAGEDTQAARAIYDKVLADVVYDKSGEGWGQGDVVRVCSIGKGNCSDFHSLFISMNRALKKKAVYEIGFSVGIAPNDELVEKVGEICGCGYHCWAWFEDGETWRPVDISEASKAKVKDGEAWEYEYFYGGLCKHRLGMSQGRDITLEPKQKGAPINFFIHPYVEIDGKPGGAKVTKTANWQPIGTEESHWKLLPAGSVPSWRQ